MRLVIRNPYGDYFVASIVQDVRRDGLRYVFPRMRFTSDRERKLDRLLSSLSYDYRRHEFFFERDVEVRRAYYDGACMVLRDAVKILEELLPEMALVSFATFSKF